MTLGLKRTDLQRLAEAKMEDARFLLNNNRAASAYYLAGYAVEIGLKACIARQVQQDTLPEKGFIEAVYKQGHNLAELVGLAGLALELKRLRAGNADFNENWSVVLEWKPDSRYRIIDIYSSQSLIEAIGNPDTGVLQWIKTYW